MDQHIGYNSIRTNILFMPHSPLALEHLKKLYEKDIKSRRTYDKIRSLLDFIKVLEKRAILNEENEDSIRQIQSLFQSYLFPNDNSNVSNGATQNGIPTTNNYQFSRILCNPDVKRKVYAKIATEIGKKWIDLARNLKMSEHDIDELEKRGANLKDIVYNILRFHEEHADPNYWKSALLDALEDARRKDLKKKVQSIFDMPLH